MTIKNSQSREVATAVSKAKSAFERGKLDQYGPLAASGTKEVKSTCAASWGPMMRR